MTPPADTIMDMYEDTAMNVTEAAQYLGVSRNTMRRFIREGVVPTFRAGTVTRIRRADLDSLFTAERTGAGHDAP